jgi:hypothetical protein
MDIRHLLLRTCPLALLLPRKESALFRGPLGFDLTKRKGTTLDEWDTQSIPLTWSQGTLSPEHTRAIPISKLITHMKRYTLIEGAQRIAPLRVAPIA